MQILRPTVDPKRFFDGVHRARRRVLMLDYDGTLAPFHAERRQAVPYPGVRERLMALMATRTTRLVLISGRIAREVALLLGIDPAPEVWGTHGWERLHPDGRYEPPRLPPAVSSALAREGARLAADWGERLERKPASVALHLRGLAEAERDAAEAEIAERWRALAGAGLELHPFDGGLELRAPDRSKATAVQAVLAEGERAGVGDIACAYLGDDRTDEDAFVAIEPHGLAVLVRPELRETAAAWWLRPPDELLTFLDQWLAACGGNG